MASDREYDAERSAASKAKKLLEEKIGRKLQPKEYVYPKDGDFFNLSVDNLELITPKDPRSVYYEEDAGSKRSFGCEVFP